jgi:DNA-binding MarR family transcriptional regulator
MTVDQAVTAVQVAYPQVYLACHTRHQRKRSTEHRLSSRDSSILAHLDEAIPVAPGRLATHLGIARSTMSEALAVLIRLGYVARATPIGAAVVLTARGRRAIEETSVLETGRLHAVLASLSPADRRLVSRGLMRLAAACRALSEAADWGAARAGTAESSPTRRMP